VQYRVENPHVSYEYLEQINLLFPICACDNIDLSNERRMQDDKE